MTRLAGTLNPRVAMFMQAVSLTGAVLILAAYVANQRAWLSPTDRVYSLMNLVGALLLGYVAVLDNRWGFILLEGVWALVSIPPLLRRTPSRAPA